MRESPILFSAPMVRAILDGRKTQTRRIMKPQWPISAAPRAPWNGDMCCCGMTFRSPYGQAGDRLWVRETHSIYPTHGQHRADGLRWGPWAGLPTVVSPDGTQIAYFREGFDRSDPGRWRPSIHMPRWASRITLEITGVRVERLQEISEDDAIAEGAQPFRLPVNPADEERRHVLGLQLLWESISGADSWNANPWVWVVSFRRLSGQAEKDC